MSLEPLATFHEIGVEKSGLRSQYVTIYKNKPTKVVFSINNIEGIVKKNPKFYSFFFSYSYRPPSFFLSDYEERERKTPRRHK